MARLKMRIPKKPPHRPYMPDELVEEGFVGEVEILSDAFTATMVKPGTPGEKVIESMALALKDAGLRSNKKIRVIVEGEEI